VLRKNRGHTLDTPGLICCLSGGITVSGGSWTNCCTDNNP